MNDLTETDGNEMVEQDSAFNYSPVNGDSIQAMPITGQGGFTELVLGDTEFSKKLKLKHFEIFNKDNVLSFQSPETKRDKLLNFDIMNLLELFNTDYYEYTYGVELDNEKLRHIFETKIDRAVGTKVKDYTNERKTLQSQFTEVKNINEMNQSNNDIRGNFFKKLLSRNNSGN